MIQIDSSLNSSRMFNLFILTIFLFSLSHGYMTDVRRVSATSKYFESMPYRLDVSNLLCSIFYSQLWHDFISFGSRVGISFWLSTRHLMTGSWHSG